MIDAPTNAAPLNANPLNKVPQVTLVFWMIKIMATTVGETGADFLIFNYRLGLAVTSLLMSGFLLAALMAQVGAKRYIPWLYWVTVVLVSVVGTLITDNLTDGLGIPLEVSTTVFGGLLLLTFALWFLRERTLSIHTIVTIRRELFYWAAILFTFALGTAAGDLVAERLALGYVVSGMIFASMIAAVAIAYFVFKIDEVWAFWIAYILTRPFGASFGDFVSQPQTHGGLGLGTWVTSASFLAIIVLLIGLLSFRQKDDPSAAAPL